MFIPLWLLWMSYLLVAVYVFVIFEMDELYVARFWNIFWALLWPIHLVITISVAIFFWVLGD